MIRAIAVIAVVLVMGLAAGGCASYGDYDDTRAPYGTGGGGGGGGGSCH